jgi:DNA (cytosine-5)-methyltransferase 1
VPTSAFTVVSLFAGAGGLDIGLERAGFGTVAANDCDKHACATLRSNQQARHVIAESADRLHLAGTKIVEGDVAEFAGADFVPDGARSSWRPDALVGGAAVPDLQPCWLATLVR